MEIPPVRHDDVHCSAGACWLRLATKYDTLDTEYQQLNQTMSAEVAANQMQITRLQNAIKVTVNNELLFPSGDWQMPAQAQQTIGKTFRS